MLYETISRICQQRGYSIAGVEKASGLPNATICKWKTSVPRVDTLKKVADALGVTIDELLQEGGSEYGS